MTTTELQPDAAKVTPQFDTLEAAYRAARDTFHGALNGAAANGEELAEDIEDTLSEAHMLAIDAVMLHPAGTAHQLARKMEIFNAEGMFNGWSQTRAITAALEADAKRIADRADAQPASEGE